MSKHTSPELMSREQDDAIEALRNDLIRVEKLLEGLEDFNLASVIHNFRFKIEGHSARLNTIEKHLDASETGLGLDPSLFP